ncbi:hypothetical protein WDU94_005517 [Cyamophila willieti]
MKYEPTWKVRLEKSVQLMRSELSRYNKSEKRKIQNRNYIRDKKRFFSQLFSHVNPSHVNIEANETEFLEFWRNIWNNNGDANLRENWKTTLEEETNALPGFEYKEITMNEVTECIKKTSNWKAPGPEKVHNFWIKYLTSTHRNITKSFNECLENNIKFPEFLIKGKTTLIHKKNNQLDPKNYRPITCLPTLYKLFTSIISNKVYSYCTEHNILDEAQKGCVKGSMGCKHQMTIDAVILKQAKTMKRNLSMCYIDYVKAYDSVPHNWLIQVMEMYKICPKIIGMLKHLMKHWTLDIHHQNKNIGHVQVKQGIFQGDSYSSLWFCLALNPLATLLKNANIGYRPKTKETLRISHLSYIDDIKLFAESRENLSKLIDITQNFSDDIKMKFGMEKCAIINVHRGKVIQNDKPIHEIHPLQPNEEYKYLGILENQEIDHNKLKENFKEEYRKRVTKLLNTYLNGRNMIDAINTWAVPSLTYSFGIVKWNETELEELDFMTRRLLCKFRMLHPKACIERLYLPRKEGGRGLVNIKLLCMKQELKMKERFQKCNDETMKKIVQVDKKYTALNLSENIRPDVHPTTNQDLINTWKSKSLHGRYLNFVNDENINKNVSFNWMKNGYLHPETEGFYTAIQDKVIRTRNYEKIILKNDITDKCRKCQQVGETIEHIMGGCSELANNMYLSRHNQVAKVVHQNLAIEHKLIKHTTPFYKYSPEQVIENDNAILYWDQPIQTDRSITCNRPDLILVNKRTQSAIIIDIAVPLTHNIIKTENEKLNKYQELKIEITRIWKLKSVIIVPIVMSTEGLVSKKILKTSRNTPHSSLKKQCYAEGCHSPNM